MNTKVIMTGSAVFLGIIGIFLSFAPHEVVLYLEVESNALLILVLQVLGALYFAFGMLNWMSKSSHIGGIYNRPITIGNFTHFMIAGLALAKDLMTHPDRPFVVWGFVSIYLLLAVCFGVLLFRHPSSGGNLER